MYRESEKKTKWFNALQCSIDLNADDETITSKGKLRKQQTVRAESEIIKL